MAVPRVFVSSTCYDLKYIREDLRYFINNMGFESILSEEGDVFYSPNQHTHDACLSEIPNCQIFVLIIGGRYGGSYRKENKSITNMEYNQAVKSKIPVFALVESNVWNDHFVYQKNKKNPEVNAEAIIYPNVDNLKIFEFIDEVRKSESNNALYPFRDFRDIEQYLKKQWAGLLYDFLTNSIETRKVNDLFEEIHRATEKIEYYTKQVASKVGDAYTNVLINCYDIMNEYNVVQDLKVCWKINVTPHAVIKSQTLDDICENKIVATEEDVNSISYGGPPYQCTRIRYDILEEEYAQMRERLVKMLGENSMTDEDFLNAGDA